MRKIFQLVALLLCISNAQISFGQSDKEKAYEMGRRAVGMMDSGMLDESIQLLEKAQKLDPDQYLFPYEMAYAYYVKGEYKQSVKILEKLKGHKDVSDRLFQLLGNSYDMLGKTDKAFAAYDAGLKKFPNSGLIYLEKGNVYWTKKEYGKALGFYEKGIEVDPKFPSNYYRACRVYCGSTEEIWGLMYGEIFMNLERNSARTAEISKLLFNTYKNEITFKNDTSIQVSLCQQMFMSIGDLSDTANLKLPFCLIMEPAVIMAVLPEKSIDLHSLDRIRTRFLDNYFDKKWEKTYPNALYNYQKMVKDAGHFEAYNHWILMKGDEEAFDGWLNANKDKWDAFVKWFSENPLKLSDNNKFYSRQY